MSIYIPHPTAIEPCVIWLIPSPSIRDPDCRHVIFEKSCIVGAQRAGSIVIFHCILYRLKMHIWNNLLDNHHDSINPFTLKKSRREMFSFEYLFFTAMLARKAVLTWSWWYDFTADNSVEKVASFDCYKLNDRGRMEAKRQATSDVEICSLHRPFMQHKSYGYVNIAAWEISDNVYLLYSIMLRD